jgi:hypothetical protein
MTTWPSKIPSFPGLTGESRKALDARLRPAGMTRKQEWNFKMCQFNYETLNISRFDLKIVSICRGNPAWLPILRAATSGHPYKFLFGSGLSGLGLQNTRE